MSVVIELEESKQVLKPLAVEVIMVPKLLR